MLAGRRLEGVAVPYIAAPVLVGLDGVTRGDPGAALPRRTKQMSLGFVAGDALADPPTLDRRPDGDGPPDNGRYYDRDADDDELCSLADAGDADGRAFHSRLR